MRQQSFAADYVSPSIRTMPTRELIEALGPVSAGSARPPADPCQQIGGCGGRP
jgi:hypothetical protein